MLEILISVRELQDLVLLSYVRQQGDINLSEGSCYVYVISELHRGHYMLRDFSRSSSKLIKDRIGCGIIVFKII